jgi:hypothetical protein
MENILCYTFQNFYVDVSLRTVSKLFLKCTDKVIFKNINNLEKIVKYDDLCCLKMHLYRNYDVSSKKVWSNAKFLDIESQKKIIDMCLCHSASHVLGYILSLNFTTKNVSIFEELFAFMGFIFSPTRSIPIYFAENHGKITNRYLCTISDFIIKKDDVNLFKIINKYKVKNYYEHSYENDSGNIYVFLYIEKPPMGLKKLIDMCVNDRKENIINAIWGRFPQRRQYIEQSIKNTNITLFVN